MPAYRRRRPARRAPRAKMGRRMALFRSKVLRSSPVFTESVNQPLVTSGTGGVFNVAFSTIPQYVNYQRLYRTFRILKLQVLILPDQTTGESIPAGSASTVGRFVYAVNDSADLPAPANELEVLEDNGCKIRSTSRPIKVSCRPQPALTSNGVLVNSTRNQWVDIDTGLNILHNGISFWFSNFAGTQECQIYYKITFALKDPR